MIRLETFEKADFKQLIEWINEEELLTMWSGNLFRFPLTEESLDWYITDTNKKKSSSAFVYKAINEEGAVIGHVSLGGISWSNRSARLTRVLIGNTGERGKGCCQEMIKAVLKIAFEELNLHRVSLGVYDTNHSATKCYEKSGFMKEGIHRDIMWYKEQWWNLIEMSILENEWQQANPVAGHVSPQGK